MGGVSRGGGTSSTPARVLPRSLLRSFLVTGSDLLAACVGRGLAWPSPAHWGDSLRTHLAVGDLSHHRWSQLGRHPGRAETWLFSLPSSIMPRPEPARTTARTHSSLVQRTHSYWAPTVCQALCLGLGIQNEPRNPNPSPSPGTHILGSKVGQ
jgi:hypothetical protein